MTRDFPDFDEAAIRKVNRIERAIVKLQRGDQGAFIAITNALEHHLEIGSRDPETVRLLARALAAFSRSRDIDPTADGFDGQLRSFLEYA